MSNNAAERELRCVALGRKSWLFCYLTAGGGAADMYGLIVTAKMNGVDPQAWLADVLARIAGHPAHRLDGLRPGTGSHSLEPPLPRGLTLSTRSPASEPSTASPKTSAKMSTSCSTSPSKWSPRTASSGSWASVMKASWPSTYDGVDNLVELIKHHPETSTADLSGSASPCGLRRTATQRVAGGLDLGAQTAAGAPEGRASGPLFCRWAPAAVPMGAHDGRVGHQPFQIGR